MGHKYKLEAYKEAALEFPLQFNIFVLIFSPIYLSVYHLSIFYLTENILPSTHALDRQTLLETTFKSVWEYFLTLDRRMARGQHSFEGLFPLHSFWLVHCQPLQRKNLLKKHINA